MKQKSIISMVICFNNKQSKKLNCGLSEEKTSYQSFTLVLQSCKNAPARNDDNSNKKWRMSYYHWISSSRSSIRRINTSEATKTTRFDVLVLLGSSGSQWQLLTTRTMLLAQFLVPSCGCDKRLNSTTFIPCCLPQQLLNFVIYYKC